MGCNSKSCHYLDPSPLPILAVMVVVPVVAADPAMYYVSVLEAASDLLIPRDCFPIAAVLTYLNLSLASWDVPILSLEFVDCSSTLFRC